MTTETGPDSSRSTAGRGPAGPPIDVARCLAFAFEDPAWAGKLVIGSLMWILSLVLVGGVFLGGYSVRLIRRVARGREPPLPEWDDFGGIFFDGLLATAIALAHLIPVGVVYGLFVVLAAVATAGRGEAPPLLGLLSFFAALSVAVAFLVVILYLPAAVCRFAVEGRWAAAFEPSANIAFIRRNLVGYVVALMVALLAQFIAQFGVLALCVGIIPATVWGSWVASYALGEVTRRDPQLRTVGRQGRGG